MSGEYVRERAVYTDWALAHWDQYGYWTPRNARQTIGVFCDRGLSLRVVRDLMDAAVTNPWVHGSKWRYFCGAAWNTIREPEAEEPREVASRELADALADALGVACMLLQRYAQQDGDGRARAALREINGLLEPYERVACG